MGPEPMCSKYNKVNIGGVFYRTRDGDKGKVTTQCFVRASFPKNDADADDEWEDRYGIINAILRVSIGGVLYTFLKCDWLPVPTEAQIASFKLKNSILGVDKVSKAYYTFNPWDTSKYTMDNREPYLLANQVQAQVVIVKHPCMDSAVILDTSDRNMEKLALVDRPVVGAGETGAGVSAVDAGAVDAVDADADAVATGAIVNMEAAPGAVTAAKKGKKPKAKQN
ncbi:hypothetical protein CYMTET_50812 [Cymbomonas tetramitiformis]|uniref:Uncharacterized protein n=1 Tax=Cymbomonas tetramitiformis TaxID=36881 RepID=A0AAE0BMD7_9CHLO|nr:hypothetical protein CYMTET_50812 [Cymbomonas tetramitiformis]